MRWLLLAALLGFQACAHKTRLDCIEHCKQRGLNYVGISDTTTGYDPVEREVKQGEACRCEYGNVPR